VAPSKFVDACSAYQYGEAWPNASTDELQLRATDLFVRQTAGIQPRSVSASSIAVPAFRAAALFATVAEQEEMLDRSGAGKFVEVYPRAACIRWGLENGRGADLDVLLRAAEWLRVEDGFALKCRTRRVCFDALLAALAARAAGDRRL
jgi:hypothetical protein